jgi:hypothetical protein
MHEIMTSSAEAPREEQSSRLATDEEVDLIVSRGPSGAFAVAGVATAIVVALYTAFYIFVYLPRGAVQ